ncbi:MAG: nitroreductase [Chloroflexota bacterium]|nr:nitroreductase [Chloroflexota bacterium]
MELVEAIGKRKSIRGYKPTPVPKDVIWKVIDVSRRAPSAMNTQPWEITVISGDVIENIKKQTIENMNSGVLPNPDVTGKLFQGVYRDRQVDLAKQIFGLMGIAREDREKRGEWMMRGFRFFDAPAAIIIAVDRSLGEGFSEFDIGSISQTICLVALEHGLGTCIEDQGIMYPDVVRKFTGIPDSKRLVVCMAIGYPDWDFPANRLESTREPVDKIVTWCGFE